MLYIWYLSLVPNECLLICQFLNIFEDLGFILSQFFLNFFQNLILGFILIFFYLIQVLNVFLNFILDQLFFNISQNSGFILVFFAAMRIITIIIDYRRTDAKEYYNTGLGRDEIEHQKGERSNNLSLAGFSSASISIIFNIRRR